MQIFEQVFSEKLQKSFGGRSPQNYDHALSMRCSIQLMSAWPSFNALAGTFILRVCSPVTRT